MHHFGPISGGVGYYSHSPRDHTPDMELDGQPYDEPGYLTDLISNRAVQYVKDRAVNKEPFMLSLHYTAPHWPLETRAQGKIDPQIAATILDIAGAKIPDGRTLDGVSMLPTLKDANVTFPRPLFWRMKYNEQHAYRMGDWKYLKVNEHEYLFNISNDARERANQARREPERLAAMRATFDEWNTQIPDVPEDARVTLNYTLADMPAR